MATRKRSRRQSIDKDQPEGVVVSSEGGEAVDLPTPEEKVVEVKAGPEAQTTETLVSMKGPFTTVVRTCSMA